MSRTAKSQWDFGDELFPTEQTRKVLSVGELTTQVRRLLETQIGGVWVSGEITNLRAQSSGHVYFTLKDALAQLQCVLFKGEATGNRTCLQDGQKVVLRGEITVYAARGQYQLRVTSVELQGIGALQAAFEKMKSRLQAEGWFAPERKRPLPRFPQRIGLVTSPTGAAIRDVLHVMQRRHPSLEIILAPAKVQGDGAAPELAAAIRRLNEWSQRNSEKCRLDLLLITRGGGSLEDLWAFNEEIVARAIFESKLPVVSAVGHEIDFTISDFVADFRAATPSAAAEIITEGVFSKGKFILEASARLRQRAAQQLERVQQYSQQWSHRLNRVHPRRRLHENLQHLDDLRTSLGRSTQRGWRKQFAAWHHVRERLERAHPTRWLKQRTEFFQQQQERLPRTLRHRLEKMKSRLAAAESRLRLLSPSHVLARGYSITLDAVSGKALRTADGVVAGQKLQTKLMSGEIWSITAEKPEEKSPPA